MKTIATSSKLNLVSTILLLVSPATQTIGVTSLFFSKSTFQTPFLMQQQVKAQSNSHYLNLGIGTTCLVAVIWLLIEDQRNMKAFRAMQRANQEKQQLTDRVEEIEKIEALLEVGRQYYQEEEQNRDATLNELLRREEAADPLKHSWSHQKTHHKQSNRFFNRYTACHPQAMVNKISMPTHTQNGKYPVCPITAARVAPRDVETREKESRN